MTHQQTTVSHCNDDCCQRGGGHHEHPPTTLSTRPKGSGIAHKHTMHIDKPPHAATHQRPRHLPHDDWRAPVAPPTAIVHAPKRAMRITIAKHHADPLTPMHRNHHRQQHGARWQQGGTTPTDAESQREGAAVRNDALTTPTMHGEVTTMPMHMVRTAKG